VRARELFLAVVVGGTLAALVGCSSSTAGEALPTDTGNTTTSTTRSTGSSVPRTSESPVAQIDPCLLLSDSERAQLGLGVGEPEKIGRSKLCQWQQSGVWTVGIGIKPDLAFKDADLRGATPIRVDIGRHEAYRVENADNGKACEIFVVTGPSSFAQVTVAYGTDIPKACEKALPVAKIVDPKLP